MGVIVPIGAFLYNTAMLYEIERPLKVVQYGMCHEHAGAKMRTLKSLAKEGIVEILGVVNDRESKSPRTTQIKDFSDFDGIKVLTAGEFDALQGVEAVLVETTNADLLGPAASIASRGLPMHLDKPCGETYGRYASVVEMCRARNLPLQMGYMFRTNPAMRFIRDIVARGVLGDVFSIEADMDHDYGDDGYQRYIGTMRGGLMYNLGCHLIDFVCSLLPDEPITVHPVLRTAPGDPAGIANNCVTVMEYPGALVTLRACSRAVNGISHRRLRVDGTKGTVELSPLERFDGKELVLELDLKKPEGGYPAGKTVVGCGVQIDRYDLQFRELAEIVRGKRPNPDTYDHDLKVHRLTLMASGIEMKEERAK